MSRPVKKVAQITSRDGATSRNLTLSSFPLSLLFVWAIGHVICLRFGNIFGGTKFENCRK